MYILTESNVNDMAESMYSEDMGEVKAWTRLEFKVPTELSEAIQDKVQKFIDLEVYRYEQGQYAGN